MVAKKSNYINAELDWAEDQLVTWREYVSSNPLPSLVDRIEYRQTKTGAMPMVIASIEQQGKFIQETMKNYLSLLEIVDKLREIEESKKSARGKSSVPPRMQ